MAACGRRPRRVGHGPRVGRGPLAAAHVQEAGQLALGVMAVPAAHMAGLGSATDMGAYPAAHHRQAAASSRRLSRAVQSRCRRRLW
jgi:hypothetical protein